MANGLTAKVIELVSDQNLNSEYEFAHFEDFFKKPFINGEKPKLEIYTFLNEFPDKEDAKDNTLLKFKKEYNNSLGIVPPEKTIEEISKERKELGKSLKNHANEWHNPFKKEFWQKPLYKSVISTLGYATLIGGAATLALSQDYEMVGGLITGWGFLNTLLSENERRNEVKPFKRKFEMLDGMTQTYRNFANNIRQAEVSFKTFEPSYKGPLKSPEDVKRVNDCLKRSYKFHQLRSQNSPTPFYKKLKTA